MTNERRVFLRWRLPFYLWLVVILALTSYPKLTLPETGFSSIDKLGHLGVYFVLGLLALRFYIRDNLANWRGNVSKAMVFCILFAVFDEIHQCIIPGRSADIWDALADIAGILLALLTFWLASSRRMFFKRTVRVYEQ